MDRAVQKHSSYCVGKSQFANYAICGEAVAIESLDNSHMDIQNEPAFLPISSIENQIKISLFSHNTPKTAVTLRTMSGELCKFYVPIEFQCTPGDKICIIATVDIDRNFGYYSSIMNITENTNFKILDNTDIYELMVVESVHASPFLVKITLGILCALLIWQLVHDPELTLLNEALAFAFLFAACLTFLLRIKRNKIINMLSCQFEYFIDKTSRQYAIQNQSHQSYPSGKKERKSNLIKA